MNDTDVDSPTALLDEQESPVKTPWEPMEPAGPASLSAKSQSQDSATASTAALAVEAGPARKKPRARKPRKARAVPQPEPTPEVEAELASQAFLSDTAAAPVASGDVAATPAAASDVIPVDPSQRPAVMADASLCDPCAIVTTHANPSDASALGTTDASPSDASALGTTDAELSEASAHVTTDAGLSDASALVTTDAGLSDASALVTTDAGLCEASAIATVDANPSDASAPATMDGGLSDPSTTVTTDASLSAPSVSVGVQESATTDSVEGPALIPAVAKKPRKRATAKARRGRGSRVSASAANPRADASADALAPDAIPANDPASIDHTPWAVIQDTTAVPQDAAALAFVNEPITPDMLAAEIDWPMRSDEAAASSTTYGPTDHDLAVTTSEHVVQDAADFTASFLQDSGGLTRDAVSLSVFDSAEPATLMDAPHDDAFVKSSPISVDASASDPADGPVAISHGTLEERLEELGDMDDSAIAPPDAQSLTADAADFSTPAETAAAEEPSLISTESPLPDSGGMGASPMSLAQDHGRAARATKVDADAEAESPWRAELNAAGGWDEQRKITADLLSEIPPTTTEVRPSDILPELAQGNRLPDSGGMGSPMSLTQDRGRAARATTVDADAGGMGGSPISLTQDRGRAARATTVDADADIANEAMPLASPLDEGRFSHAPIDAATSDSVTEPDSLPPRPASFDGHVTVFRELPAPIPHAPAEEPAPAAGEAGDETAAMFAMTDSVTTAASELATSTERFHQSAGEQAGDQKILVANAGSASADHLMTAPLAALSPEAQAEPEPEVELLPELAPVATTGGGWTIPLLCLGIGLIACCIAIPQIDANRRLNYERLALAAELQSVQKQVSVNDEFLHKVTDDPTLAERLAARQMKTIRRGDKVLALAAGSDADADEADMSPFTLTTVPHPAPPAPYRPINGTIANICYNARSRLYLLGSAMTMAAIGLVMGFAPARKSDSMSDE